MSTHTHTQKKLKKNKKEAEFYWLAHDRLAIKDLLSFEGWLAHDSRRYENLPTQI